MNRTIDTAQSLATRDAAGRVMLSWWGTVLLCLLLSGRALAQDASVTAGAPNAKGSIIIDGKATDLPYAYAYTAPALSSRKPETILILAAQPLPPKSVTDPFARMKARGSGNGMLEFTFDETRALTSVQFGVEPMGGGGYSTSYKFAIASWTDRQMRGRVYTDGELEMFKNRYRFDVSFDITMTVPRAPEASGKDAWATPQGKVLAEYLRAARAGDKAALKRVIVADRAKDLDGPMAKDILSFLKESADPKTADFDSLTVDGETAEAKITERNKDGAMSSTLRLQRVNSSWMVAP